MIFLKRTTHKIKHKKQKKLSYLKVIQSLELFGLIHLNDFLIIVSIRQPVPQQGKFSLSLSLSMYHSKNQVFCWRNWKSALK